jgi:hypothetical protein
MLSSVKQARGDILCTIVGGPCRLEVLAIVVAALVTFHKSSGISFLQRHDNGAEHSTERDSSPVERAVLDK